MNSFHFLQMHCVPWTASMLSHLQFFFFHVANSSQPSGHSKHPFLLDPKDWIRKLLPMSSLRTPPSPAIMELLTLH